MLIKKLSKEYAFFYSLKRRKLALWKDFAPPIFVT